MVGAGEAAGVVRALCEVVSAECGVEYAVGRGAWDAC